MHLPTYNRMFNNKKTDRLPETRSSSFNLIAHGTEITGDIATTGDLRVDGRVNGRCTTSRSLALPEYQPEVKLISNEKPEAITD